MLTLNCSATQELLATDHVILNHGQVTWTTPKLAPTSPNYHTNGRSFQLSTDLTCIVALHDLTIPLIHEVPSSVENKGLSPDISERGRYDQVNNGLCQHYLEAYG
ncbi:hypothetical protein TNCV_631851 [Trichonephila clavipes]|nr:hypothetical protein TNCV_631851 [Trichonephila clavipes]